MLRGEKRNYREERKKYEREKKLQKMECKKMFEAEERNCRKEKCGKTAVRKIIIKG